MPNLDGCPDFLRSIIESRPDRIPNAFSGTDIKRLMKGDWPELYLELTGQSKPEPLLDLAPNLGKYLEPFHREWYEWQSGNEVTGIGRQPVKEIEAYATPADLPAREDPRFQKWDSAYVTLDGMVETVDSKWGWIPWEAKTTHGLTKRDALVDRELPQLQWQMYVTDTPFVEMSIMYLNSRWEAIIIERDDELIERILAELDQFRDYLVRGVMPQAQVIERVTAVRERVDMRTSADWQDFEDLWLSTRQPARQFKEAEKHLKAAIPPDAKEGFGALLKFTRNKAGALSLFPMKAEERDTLPPTED